MDAKPGGDSEFGSGPATVRYAMIYKGLRAANYFV
jgi:hypothetical protein